MAKGKKPPGESKTAEASKKTAARKTKPDVRTGKTGARKTGKKRGTASGKTPAQKKVKRRGPAAGKTMAHETARKRRPTAKKTPARRKPTRKPSPKAKKEVAATKPKRPAWMPTPPTPEEKKRARRIGRALARAHPEAKISLDFGNPLELYVATVLSAQCTDERVNKVTPALFSRFRSAEDYARIPRARLEKMIQPTGFFRNKAKMIQEACRALAERFGGEVPRTMEELRTLPGVGRKTANVILGNAFDTPGMVVDTHVRRLSQRMGFTTENDPERIEQDLMLRIPRKEWTEFSHRMIHHGRNICHARRPRCEVCPVRKDCPYPEKIAEKPAA